MQKAKQVSKLLNKHSFLIAFIFSSLFSLAGSLVSLNRFWQYEVFYYDFGIFDKAIWEVSRFSTPIIHHIVLGEKIIFADHFSPSIFMFSLLFWFFPQSETLLVAQACAVGISGFVLFSISKRVLKNSFYAISIMASYLLFEGLQNAVITDFHEVTVATLFFMLTFLCVVAKKKKLYFLCFMLLLGFKETMFLLGIGMVVAVFFTFPKWRKVALVSAIIAVIWGIVSIKVVIPYFSGGLYLYATEIPTNPATMIASFFDSPIKQRTIYYTFRNFGFLPLFSPAFWIIIFQDLLIRFYPQGFVERWALGFHYSALTTAIMGVSSVFSIKMLQSKIKQKYLTVLVLLLLLNSLYLYRFVLHGPFGLSYNSALYAHTKDFVFLEKAIKKIPKNASVMTQNNIFPHFTHQKSWLLISDIYAYKKEFYTSKNPDYILIDNRSGQNLNNYYGVRDMNVLITNLQKDTTYKNIYKDGSLWMFKKI